MIKDIITDIVYNLFNTKYNYMNYDLCNYICKYIVYPECSVTVHYEENIKKKVIPRSKKLDVLDFTHGFMKCILHKKYKLKQQNIIPFMRKDIYYFTNYDLYNNELLYFLQHNSLHYLQIYEEIMNYINSYSSLIDLGDNYKMYVIYYYNKGNSVDLMMNRIINTSSPIHFQ